MLYDDNDNVKVYKNFFFTVVVVLLVSVIYYFINMGSDTAVQNVRPKALEFMYYVQNNNFDLARKMLLNDSIDLKKMFTGDGIVLSYKEAGFGADSKTDIWINMFVNGLPAENRNININFKKVNDKWLINNIVTDYHINRIDKLNVLLFIDKIISGNYNSAHKLTRNIDDARMYKIKDVIDNYRNSTDWVIIKAENMPAPHLKNKIPEETKIFIQSADKKYTLQFICKKLKKEHWIGDIRIIDSI